MKSKSVLMIGCGDLGARAGRLLLDQGYSVSGMRRQPKHLPTGFGQLTGDYTQAADLAKLAQLAPDYLVVTLKPTSRDAAGYRRGFVTATSNVLQGLGAHRPEGILWVSSTRVFAETGGAWVDESSPVDTADPATAAIVDAERMLAASVHRSCAIRFAGIYGDPDGRLLTRAADGAARASGSIPSAASTPVHYSNRIHREDAGAALAFLIAQWSAGRTLEQVYIGADSMPAPTFEVESWLASELGGVSSADSPPAQATEPAGKRCRNTRLLGLGFRFSYPEYRSGYRQVLKCRFPGPT